MIPLIPTVVFDFMTFGGLHHGEQQCSKFNRVFLHNSPSSATDCNVNPTLDVSDAESETQAIGRELLPDGDDAKFADTTRVISRQASATHTQSQNTTQALTLKKYFVFIPPKAARTKK